MHPPESLLHSYLNQELPPDDYARIQKHIATCPLCQEQLAVLKQRAELISLAFSQLKAGSASTEEITNQAYQEFLSNKESFAMRKTKYARLKAFAFAATAVAVVIFAFSFAPVRAWAAQFLGLFRVEQITVLPVDISSLERLNGNEPLINQLSTVMSDSLKVTKDPGDSQVVPSTQEASELAGFTVRGVKGMESQEISVNDSAAFEFTMDRELAQAVIEASGRSDLILPESLDGALIATEIPASAVIKLGSCPTTESAKDLPSGAARRFDCTTVIQVPSPTITTPPELDIQQLALVGLQIAGMTEQEAEQFSKNIDWSSTLVIPIPSGVATYEEVSVDGVIGNLITETDSPRSAYTLLWVKNGIVYAVSGFGPPESGLAVANALE